MAISSPSDDTATASVTPLVSLTKLFSIQLNWVASSVTAHQPSSWSVSLVASDRPRCMPACRPERALRVDWPSLAASASAASSPRADSTSVLGVLAPRTRFL